MAVTLSVFAFGVWFMYTTNDTLRIITTVSGSTQLGWLPVMHILLWSLNFPSTMIFIYVVVTPWTTNVSHNPRFWVHLPFGYHPSFDHEQYHVEFRFLVQTLRYPPRSDRGVQRCGCTLCEYEFSVASRCRAERSTNKFAWVKLSNCTWIAWILALFSSRDVCRSFQSLMLCLNRTL